MIFEYDIKIDAPTEQSANETAEALFTIYQKIDKQHLVWVANKIKEDPNVIKKVIGIANNPLVQKMF